MTKKPINKYYFDHPEIWEGISRNIGRFKGESKFLINILKKYGKVGKILDVGCGTGSHLYELSKSGFNSLGIDLNKNMIKYAKNKYPKLKFEIKGMRKLGYSNQFNVIICLCTTFCYNISNEEITSALKSFNKALKRNGLLIIEVLNPIAFIEKKGFIKRFEDKKFEKLGIRSITENKIDEKNQIMIEKRHIYSLKNNKKLKTDTTKFRLFFPQEMKYFLESNGFKFMGFYGDYNIKYKKLDKSKLIILSKKI